MAVLDADVALERGLLPAPPETARPIGESRPLAFVMALNPLTYGVAAPGRLLYEGVAGAIGPDTPSLPLAWGVSLGFAAAMLVLAWLHGRPADDGRFAMNSWAVRGWILVAFLLAVIYAGWISVRHIASGRRRMPSHRPTASRTTRSTIFN